MLQHDISPVCLYVCLFVRLSVCLILQQYQSKLFVFYLHIYMQGPIILYSILVLCEIIKQAHQYEYLLFFSILTTIWRDLGSRCQPSLTVPYILNYTVSIPNTRWVLQRQGLAQGLTRVVLKGTSPYIFAVNTKKFNAIFSNVKNLFSLICNKIRQKSYPLKKQVILCFRIFHM